MDGKVVKFGEKGHAPLARLKFSERVKTRLAVVTEKIVVVNIHYSKQTGSFICFEGSCCKYLNFPKVRYLIPVVKYDTSTKGDVISDEVENWVLMLGREAYEDLIQINDLKPITSTDLLVTCSDEQYQKIRFFDLGQDPYWKSKPQIKASVIDFWKKHFSQITYVAGRQLDEESFRALMFGDSYSEVSSEVPSIEQDQRSSQQSSASQNVSSEPMGSKPVASEDDIDILLDND